MRRKWPLNDNVFFFRKITSKAKQQKTKKINAVECGQMGAGRSYSPPPPLICRPKCRKNIKFFALPRLSFL